MTIRCMATWLTRLMTVLAVSGLAACKDPNVVTVGAVLQLSGRLAETGRIYRDAYELTVDAVNEKGGVRIGDFQYKLALKIVDNDSESRLVVPHLDELITKERVNLLLGPYSSFDVLAASGIAEKYRLPMVQAGGASSRIASRGYRYVFGTLPPGDEYFRSTIDMLQRLSPVAKTVAIVSGDDPFDITLANATRPLLQEAGLEIVLHQQYSERSPNFDNILGLLKSRAPDVLLWTGHEPAAIAFIRDARRRSVSPNLLASYTAVGSARFRAELGRDANYIFGMTPWLPTMSHKDRWFGDAAQFAAIFERKFGYPPDYHAAAAVAAVESLVVALESARTFEPADVREAIARLDFESVYGRIRFGQSQQVELPQAVIQVQDGQVVEIFARDFINRPLYPVPAWDKRP
jgi:branched-chain amino acid transport system substrate-binding protein